MILYIGGDETWAYGVSHNPQYGAVRCDVPDDVAERWKQVQIQADAVQEEMSSFYSKFWHQNEVVVMDSTVKPPPRIDLAREIQSGILTEQIMGKDQQ